MAYLSASPHISVDTQRCYISSQEMDRLQVGLDFLAMSMQATIHAY